MNIQRKIQWSVAAATVASICFFLGYVFLKSSSRELGANIFLIILAAVAILPVVVWWALLSALKSGLGRNVFLGAGALLFGFGFLVYFDALFVHKDALNLLVFFFYPLLQMLALALLFGVIALVERQQN